MICQLCQKETELINSHIIPEFFYKPLYDEIHRTRLLSTKEGEKNKWVQKGIREKLLCNECEQLFSQWEKYINEIFFYDTVPKHIEILGDRIIISEIDYTMFKLFGLSLLWRASISLDKFFKDVILGPHQEKIRKMILYQNPGDVHDYGFMITMLTLNGNILDDLIMSPDFIWLDSHRCYRFILGGCLWLFIVSSHSETFFLRKYFLQKDGSIILLKRSAETIELINRFAYNLHSTGKLKSGAY